MTDNAINQNEYLINSNVINSNANTNFDYDTLRKKIIFSIAIILCIIFNIIVCVFNLNFINKYYDLKQCDIANIFLITLTITGFFEIIIKLHLIIMIMRNNIEYVAQYFLIFFVSLILTYSLSVWSIFISVNISNNCIHRINHDNNYFTYILYVYDIAFIIITIYVFFYIFMIIYFYYKYARRREYEIINA